MAFYERIRDVVTETNSADAVRARQSAGWQMVSIEWRREVPESEARSRTSPVDEIPYGLRLSADCARLEVDPTENAALMQMMELLGHDFSYASIVSDLNERGLRQRDGSPWTRVAVFQMMPRLIEVGPRLFAEDAWKSRQKVISGDRSEV